MTRSHGVGAAAAGAGCLRTSRLAADRQSAECIGGHGVSHRLLRENHPDTACRARSPQRAASLQAEGARRVRGSSGFRDGGDWDEFAGEGREHRSCRGDGEDSEVVCGTQRGHEEGDCGRNRVAVRKDREI